MPIFEFRCSNCNQKFEKIVISGTTKDILCPFCGSKELEKEFSTFASCGEAGKGSSQAGGGHSGMG